MKRNLSAALSRAFTAPATRKPDTQRKAREEAKALAKQHGIEVERIGSGYNVWPPKGFAKADPYDSDHFAHDWSEVLPMVRAYANA